MAVDAPVSPAAPLKAIRLWLFRALVLSSVALRTVGPRMAALDEAMMAKSFPVMPRRTSMVAAGGGGGVSATDSALLSYACSDGQHRKQRKADGMGGRRMRCWWWLKR